MTLYYLSVVPKELMVLLLLDNPKKSKINKLKSS